MGEGLQRAFAAAKATRRVQSKQWPGGTYMPTLVVDPGVRGEVRMIVDGRTFVVSGRLASGLRHLAAGITDDS